MEKFSVVFLWLNFFLLVYIKDEISLWCLKDELISFVEFKNDCVCNGNFWKNFNWKILVWYLI